MKDYKEEKDSRLIWDSRRFFFFSMTIWSKVAKFCKEIEQEKRLQEVNNLVERSIKNKVAILSSQMSYSRLKADYRV